MYELLLTSVAIAGIYWGQFFLRRRPHGTLTFGGMQVASAVLALCGVWALHDGPRPLGVLGAIGLGMGACLLVVGPMVRGAARRFAMAEHPKIARRLLDLAELLNPGAGVAEEKALLGAMTEIREGKIDQTIEALAAARGRESAESGRAIDERIAMLYLAAYRWEDAIAHAESRLFDGPPPDPKLASLREAIGLAPPVFVELLGAYGRIGNLDRAATMLEQLERACTDREDSAVWVHRARMMFLALAGRPLAVEALVARDKARHMSDAARAYWVAVAYEHTGDRVAATAAYGKARARSRGKPRELIDRAIAKLDDARPTTLSPAASEVVARAETAPVPVTPNLARPTPPRAYLGFVALNLAVAAAIWFGIGPSGDVGVLVRAGAMVRGLVDQGEWWRLISCIFIHVGAIHLFVNLTGLWFVGRLAEDMFGSSRTVAIFAGAGLAGSLASYLFSATDIMAGASGAIFGLLGAVFVELSLHRAHYRAAWKRGVWSSLAVVTVAQVAIDFMHPMIDQWAHGGGFIGGAAIAAVLSPRVRWARAGLHAARAFAIVFGIAAGFAAVMIVRTPVEASLVRGPGVKRVVNTVAITIPTAWVVDADSVSDPDHTIVVALARVGGTSTLIGKWIDGESARATQQGFEHLATAPSHLVVPPDGWQCGESIASLVDGMDFRQESRVISCGRPGFGGIVLVSIYVPETIAAMMPAYLTSLLASVE